MRWLALLLILALFSGCTPKSTDPDDGSGDENPNPDALGWSKFVEMYKHLAEFNQVWGIEFLASKPGAWDLDRLSISGDAGMVHLDPDDGSVRDGSLMNQGVSFDGSVTFGLRYEDRDEEQVQLYGAGGAAFRSKEVGDESYGWTNLQGGGSIPQAFIIGQAENVDALVKVRYSMRSVQILHKPSGSFGDFTSNTLWSKWLFGEEYPVSVHTEELDGPALIATRDLDGEASHVWVKLDWSDTESAEVALNLDANVLEMDCVEGACAVRYEDAPYFDMFRFDQTFQILDQRRFDTVAPVNDIDIIRDLDEGWMVGTTHEGESEIALWGIQWSTVDIVPTTGELEEVEQPTALRITEDGTYLAIGGHDGSVVLLDMAKVAPF